MSSDINVFFVGFPAFHHAKHSGYENFGKHIGTFLKPPVRFHWLTSQLGWRLDVALSRLISRKQYSIGMLLTEVSAAAHMLRNRNAIYHSFYGDLDLWLLAGKGHKFGHRTVATFHEPVWMLEWLKIENIVKRLDGVFLVSESQRPYFSKLLPQNRIFVIPHGIDTDFFQPGHYPGEEPICITVGGHLRDFDTLVSAIDLIKEASPHVRFHAIGVHPSGPGGNQSLPDNGNIEFFNNISDDDLRTMYQNSRLAIFSLQNATANNALLEAMACGLPVVATDVGGIREYLGDDTGVLSPPNDAQALTNGILRLIYDDSLAMQMSKLSRSRALTFDYGVVAEQMREAYANIFELPPSHDNQL